MLFEDFGNQGSFYNIDIFDIPGSNFKNDKVEMPEKSRHPSKFVSAKEGFQRGNMFADEYEPYKRLTYYKLTPKNDREEKLFVVHQFDFALNDLNLFLDLHPDDQEVYELFRQYVAAYENAKDEYEKAYGPLMLTSTNYTSYAWSKNPWPWDDMGGSQYV